MTTIRVMCLAVLLVGPGVDPAWPNVHPPVLDAFAAVCRENNLKNPVYDNACQVLPVRGDDPAVAVPLLASIGFGQTDSVHRRLLEIGLQYHGQWRNPTGNGSPGTADRIGWMLMQLAMNYNGTRDYAKTVEWMQRLDGRNMEMNAAMFQIRCRHFAEALSGLGRKDEAVQQLLLALRAKGGWESTIEKDLTKYGATMPASLGEPLKFPANTTGDLKMPVYPPSILGFRVIQQTDDTLDVEVDCENIREAEGGVVLVSHPTFQGKTLPHFGWQQTAVPFGRHKVGTRLLFKPSTVPARVTSDGLLFMLSVGMGGMPFDERRFAHKKQWHAQHDR